jgi:Uma2 family endonuclease
MPTPAGLHRYTYADYLALEAASNVKHEFLAGEIYGMAGGTPEHAALSVAVSAALLAQLRGGPCRVYSSDLRIRVLATGLATYPDVTVVCGEAERDPESPTTIVNPRLVVEVLSDSTMEYDRGEKLQHYRQMPSLEAICFVWHTQRRIETWTRAGAGEWTLRESGAGERAMLPGISCALVVDQVYRDALGPSA